MLFKVLWRNLGGLADYRRCHCVHQRLSACGQPSATDSCPDVYAAEGDGNAANVCTRFPGVTEYRATTKLEGRLVAIESLNSVSVGRVGDPPFSTAKGTANRRDRVEGRRGGLGLPLPAHRTGRADFPHPALRLVSCQGPTADRCRQLGRASAMTQHTSRSRPVLDLRFA